MDFDELDVDTVWTNGEFVDWDEATIHALSQVATAGMGVFEGTRSYPTDDGHAIFRLDAHLDRLEDSAKLLGMEMERDRAELEKATRQLARRNGLADLDGSFYYRHSASLGYGGIGADAEPPVNQMIVAFPFGRFLGEDAMATGADLMTASQRRVHSSQFPTQAKANGIYITSMLAKRKAHEDGYDTALLLDRDGNVAEAAAANVFVVRDGTLYTPGLDSSVLPGITRDALLQVARDRGYEAVEKTVTTGELLTADEAFLCGTGAEVTSVNRVDDTVIGDGGRGPITEEIQEAYFDIVHGECPEYEDWLTYL